jgi:hypothetical protein
LVGVKSSKLTMAKYIVCTLATFQFDGSSREVAKVLKMDRRNIMRVNKRKHLFDLFGVAF